MGKDVKKVGILTFHASHNYGSCLQAYALQNTVKSLGMDVEIINFRTERQKELYAVITKKKGLMRFLKNATHVLFYRGFKAKHSLFERFIHEEYNLSQKEYATKEDLAKENFSYDAVIAGSDQIWNPFPSDFDEAYYLPFVKCRKISYAPSFGPSIRKTEDVRMQPIPTYVQDFDVVSVREPQAKVYLQSCTDKEVTVTLDPTLLLDKRQWLKLVEDEPIVKGDYIFLYTLYATPTINKIAKRLSKALKMKVIVSNISNQYDVITPFKKKLATGPKEFLNLVYYSKFVLVTSFHGTVFSVLFEKPFLAINGDRDNRISNLLTMTGLTDRTVHAEDVEEKAMMPIDFSGVQSGLKKAREESLAFLENALENTNDDM